MRLLLVWLMTRVTVLFYRWSPEDDRLPAVEQHPVLGVALHGARESEALVVPAELGDLRRGHGVVDPGDFLLDDGALIQVRGDVMGGGADELDAALVGLVVRAGALEARK